MFAINESYKFLFKLNVIFSLLFVQNSVSFDENSSNMLQLKTLSQLGFISRTLLCMMFKYIDFC